MKVQLASHLPEYDILFRPCLEKIQSSNYGLNEQLFIEDLQILFNYQNFDSLKNTNPLENLKQYLIHLSEDEKRFFLNDLVRFIASLALKEREMWKEQSGLKYLVANEQDQVCFTKFQLSILLANMFLLSTPRRKEHGQSQELPHSCSKICFEFVFNICAGSAMKAKLRCIHNYFKRMYEKRNDEEYLNLKVYFQRLQFSEQMLKQNEEIVLGDIEINHDKKIEDFSQELSIHADFANQFIGGGTLYDGNVQEEILFSVSPELLVSMIFCQRMQDQEAILIIGAEKFNQYKGYGYSFEVTGEYKDNSSIDKIKNHINTYTTCIDATFFQSSSEMDSQYEDESVNREMIKCLVGFQGTYNNDVNLPVNIPVVTGNWGCGMFNGDPQLKLLIQWISCTLNNRKMIYCTLKDDRLVKEKDFILSLKGKNIKLIKEKIQNYSKSNLKSTLYEYLRNQKI